MLMPYALRKVNNHKFAKCWIQLLGQAKVTHQPTISSQTGPNSPRPVRPASLGGSGPARADILMFSYVRSSDFFLNGVAMV